MIPSAVQRFGSDRRPHGIVDQLPDARKRLDRQNGSKVGNTLDAVDPWLLYVPDQMQLASEDEGSRGARTINRSVQTRFYEACFFKPFSTHTHVTPPQTRPLSGRLSRLHANSYFHNRTVVEDSIKFTRQMRKVFRCAFLLMCDHLFSEYVNCAYCVIELFSAVRRRGFA
jgi:hypothetical protein